MGILFFRCVGSNDAKVYCHLLFMVLGMPMSIWLSLILSGLSISVWNLPPVSLGCSWVPGRPVALGRAGILGDLQTMGSSEGNAWR